MNVLTQRRKGYKEKEKNIFYEKSSEKQVNFCVSLKIIKTKPKKKVFNKKKKRSVGVGSSGWLLFVREKVINLFC